MCAMDDDCVYMNRDIDRAKNDKLCFGDDVDANKSRYYRRGSVFVRPARKKKRKKRNPCVRGADRISVFSVSAAPQPGSLYLFPPTLWMDGF